MLTGERIGRLQWLAVLLSFVGVVLVASPDFSIGGAVVLLPILVALTIAFRDLFIRRVISGEKSLALSVMVHALTVLLSGFAFDASWLTQTGEQMTLYSVASLTVLPEDRRR